MRPKHAAILIALVLAMLAAVPATASAKHQIKVRVGLGDQNAEMFANPHFQALKVRRVRYFIPYNAYRDREQRLKARRFVLAARKARARVLLHISTDDIRPKKGKLPGPRTYRRDVGKLVRYFKRLGVRDWGAWNEVNHKTQPTWTKKGAKRAAEYFKIMRRICKRCTIVALDVLDQRGVDRYMARWYKALGRRYRKYVKVVGIHNYSDVNRKRSRGTSRIIRVARRYNKRTKFWLTETGGLVEFGRSFPCSENRAASRTKYMFTLTKRYRRYIKRLYAYNWTGTDCTTRFDAGLTNADGSPRPAYNVFRRYLKQYLR